MDFADPTNVAVAWLSALDFLRHNAARVWALNMDRGRRFLLPAAAQALPSTTARARYLAQAERQRLAAAALYHLDAAATATALATELRHVDPQTLPPAPAGLMLWATPAVTADGAPIIAASWGPADDGGLWIVWWSDIATAAARRGQNADTVLGVNGYLGYDREAHLAPGTWPTQADDASHPAHMLYRAMLGTWIAIATKGVTVSAELAPTKHLRKQAARADVDATPVHCLTAVEQPDVAAGAAIAADDAYAPARDHELPDIFRWIPELYRAAAGRVHTLEHQLEDRCPGLLASLEAERARRADWPSWCWMPIRTIIRVMDDRYPPTSGLGDRLTRSRTAAIAAAIAAWRASGRPMVNVHDSLIPVFEAHADELPRDLPARWTAPCL